MINFLTNLVKESGITNIIVNYKNDLEYKDILDYYTYNGKIDWKLIESYGDIDAEFIEIYKEFLNFENLVLRNDLIRNKDFLFKFKEILDWHYITQEWGVSCEDRHLVEIFKDYIEISWFVFSDCDSYFTGDALTYMREFKDNMEWCLIFNDAFFNIEMPQEFYTEFYNYLTFLNMEYVLLY